MRKSLRFGVADLIFCAIGMACVAAAIFGFATSHGLRSMAFEGLVAALAVVSFGGRFLPDSAKLPVAINALTVFFLIGICEIGFAVFELRAAQADHSLSPYIVAAKTAGQPYDTRSRLEVITQLRSSGTDAVAPIDMLTEDALANDPARRLWPLSGISRKLTVFCNETGVYSTYMSDRYGFNNPDTVYDRPLDIAVLGDSFAQGACVAQDQSITGAIRAVDPATASFGWLGDGPLASLAALQEYAAKFRPKTVFWFFVSVDLKTLEDEKSHNELSGYLSAGHTQDLIDRQPETDRLLMPYFEKSLTEASIAATRPSATASQWLPLLDKEAAASLRLEHIRQRVVSAIERRSFATAQDAAPPTTPTISSDLATFLQILRQARADVAAWGGTLYFVFLPDWDLLQNRNDPDFVNRYGVPSSDREKILALAREAGLRVIDLYPTMASAQDVSRFFPFGLFAHYTAEANLMIGGSIAAELTR